MPLESGTTISELDESWPLGGDPTLQGDDHLRLIKQVLQSQFPGELGAGFASVINASETELNYSVGLASNIQDQFDAIDVRLDTLEAELHAPAGTRLAFNQAAPPTGWTQDITADDSMMRVVSGVGGTIGGTVGAIVHTHTTSDHVLDITEMPPHTHTYSKSIDSAARDPSGLDVFLANSDTETSPTGGGLAHNHGDTGISDIKYHDMIIAVAD